MAFDDETDVYFLNTGCSELHCTQSQICQYCGLNVDVHHKNHSLNIRLETKNGPKTRLYCPVFKFNLNTCHKFTRSKQLQDQ